MQIVGQTLDDRYRIERRIGKGAFGEVFRAHDQRLKRYVAVKVLTAAGSEGTFKTRFLRESESMAKLMHSNIVTVFDFGEFDDRPFMVLELVEGLSVLDYVTNNAPEVGDVLRWGGQICDALAYAHDNEIVHRDLTLRNVMLTEKGDVKVLDFGLAKILNAEVQSDSGHIVGTPTYLSPEQAKGERVDNRADIFAFGVCLYRILCGRFPFEAEHPVAIMYLITNEDPNPMDSTVPGELQDVILKCLEKDRDKRYSNFAQVGDALAGIGKNAHQTSISSAGDFTAYALEHRSSKRNPYLSRVMIRKPSDFFGRDREIKRIYSRLDAPHPQSISVVGERRMGKSSLLNFLYQRRNRREHMQHYRDAIFVYMDFQRGENMDTAKFIDVLMEMFSYEVESGFKGDQRERSLDTLKEAIETLDENGKRVIILMDEFDAITTNPNFEMQFFSFLRFLANNYKVAYVTSSFNDLQQMCYDKEIADSPFFNIFSNLPLRPFSHAEAVELITVPSEREGMPLAPHVDEILELSGYFPMYIQMACSSAFESIVENDGGAPDWEQVRKTFLDEATPHFAFIWERMEEGLRGNLTRVASGRRVDKKFEHVSEDLHRLGYLRKRDDGQSVVFSGSFRDFIHDRLESGVTKKSMFGSLFKRGRSK